MMRIGLPFRCVITLLALATAVPAAHAETDKGALAAKIQRIVKQGVMRKAVTSIYVSDAYSGEVVYAHHPQRKLNPASNVKLISTGAVLDLLGPTWRYRTTLYGPPAIAGVVPGSIYLVGSADPTLTAANIAELAQQLYDQNVRHVEGDIIIGNRVLRDSVTLPTLTITVRGAKIANAPPRVHIAPHVPGIRTTVSAKTTLSGRTSLRVSTRSNPNASIFPLRITGHIRRGSTRTFRRSIVGTPTVTAQLLKNALNDLGVSVTGQVAVRSFAEYWWQYTAHWRNAATQTFIAPLLPRELRHDLVPTTPTTPRASFPTPLAVHVSRPISAIVAVVNKRSHNFLADRLIMTAGAKQFGGIPTMKKGTRSMYTWLNKRAHLNTKDIVLDTGSGLSYKTRISTQTIVEVIRNAGGYTNEKASTLPVHKTFRDSLAIAGIDGTLRRRFSGSPLRGKLHGKTGTLTGIIALAGILENEHGAALTFAIVTNQSTRSDRHQVRRAHERIATALAQSMGTGSTLTTR